MVINTRDAERLPHDGLALRPHLLSVLIAIIRHLRPGKARPSAGRAVLGNLTAHVEPVPHTSAEASKFITARRGPWNIGTRGPWTPRSVVT